jgi:hypothetical protein
MGTWLVDGNPQIILFDIGSGAWKMDEYKQELWNKCNLGIPHLDIEANDAVILGYMVAQFIEEVCCMMKHLHSDFSCDIHLSVCFLLENRWTDFDEISL